jgi:hypothetical protein
MGRKRENHPNPAGAEDALPRANGCSFTPSMRPADTADVGIHSSEGDLPRCIHPSIHTYVHAHSFGFRGWRRLRASPPPSRQKIFSTNTSVKRLTADPERAHGQVRKASRVWGHPQTRAVGPLPLMKLIIPRGSYNSAIRPVFPGLRWNCMAHGVCRHPRKHGL